MSDTAGTPAAIGRSIKGFGRPIAGCWCQRRPDAGAIGSANDRTSDTYHQDARREPYGRCGCSAGEREVRKAPRKTLFKYKLHQEQELSDKAYGYVKQYY